MNIRNKDWLPYLVYSVLALCILGKLLFPGYILNFDSYFSPHPHFDNYFRGLSQWSNSVFAVNMASNPFFLVLQLLAKIIPMWFLEKLLFFLILFLSGWGMHRLMPGRLPSRYFAGLLYMINPFVYARFMAGQWGVLVAYALLPLAIGAFLKLLQDGGWKNVILISVLATFVGIVSVQGYFLLFLACFIILLIKLINERRNRSTVLNILKWSAIAAGVFFILNVYWLVPLFTTKGTILTQFSQADLFSFAPQNTSNLGIAFNIASMYGFWRNAYTYAKDLLPFWWLLFIFILFLAIYGFISKISSASRASNSELRMEVTPPPDRKKLQSTEPWLVISFALIGIIGFILALGVANTYTRPFFEWLWDNFSFFRGFRDSQKFVMLLCLAYAFLGGLGVNELLRGLRKQTKQLPRIGMTALICIALLTPAAYSFTEFGFHGQLGVTDYPQQWYDVNNYLNQDKDDFNVLFLPWHMYMDFGWLPNKDKRLGNPAQQFFDKPVIAGDNIEMPGIYTESTNPVSKYVEFLLSKSKDVSNLGELLAPLNVKYIILVNEADYPNYDFLNHQIDLKIVMQKPGITLFENEHATARTYAANSVVHIQSLDDYLALSRTQDVMEHVYVLGGGTDSGNAEPFTPVSTIEKSPVGYKVGGTTQNYTVFTVPQDVSTDNWEYTGQQPVMTNLGFMPVFKSAPDGAKIVYTRFYHVYLPCYIVAFLALVIMVILYFRKPKAKIP